VGGVRPDLFTGTAFFGASTITNVTSAVDSIAGFTFNAGAPAYTFFHAPVSLIFLTFSGAGVVTNGASVTFNLVSENGFSDRILFNNASTAGGATYNINASYITFNNTSSAGNAIITNLTPAAGSFPSTIFFGSGSSSTAGNATITNQAGTSTQFGGNSTAGNATIVNFSNFAGGFGLLAGGLVFSNSSTAGNANITNHGTMIFTVGSRAGTATIDNRSTGTINFNQASTALNANITNAGTINFTGLSSVNTAKAGSATITNGGAINFNNFSTAQTANITNNNGGTINFNSASTAGSANLTNTGTMNFNNSSTAGTATIISSGLVNFNTTDTTSTATATFNAGGQLTGTGALGNTTINNGAAFTRNVGETFGINGSLNLNAGSTLAINVTPTVAPLVTVTGTATLAGGVQVTPGQRLTAPATYRIIDAATLSGTFSGATIAGPVGLVSNPTFTYDLAAGDVFLNLGPGLLTPLLPAGVSQNVRTVASAIDKAILGGAPLSTAFASIFNLTGANLTNALSQLSGEGGNGSVQTVVTTATNQFIGTMLDPSIDGRDGGMGGTGGAPGYAEEDSEALGYARKPGGAGRDAFAKIPLKAPAAGLPDPRWTVWASGYGGSASVDGNAIAGTHSTTSRIWGTAVGADYRIGRDTLVGIAMGGGGTSFSTALGLGSGRADLFQLGVYSRHNIGAAYVAGALAYGWQDVTIDRTVTVAGTDHLRAKFDSHTFAARLESGYRFATAWLGVTPYGALQTTRVHLPSYLETAVSGSNTFALAFASQSASNVRSELGVRADKSFAVGLAKLTLRGRAAWAHDSNTNRVVSPTFQTLPGSAFTISGARPSPNAGLATAGAELAWRNGWSVAGTFEGEFSRTTESYAGKGTVKYAW
jgi:uncharacterized protein with beta-barrel porin domain